MNLWCYGIVNLTSVELQSLISRDLLVVSSATTVTDAIAQMSHRRSSCVFVVENKQLLGILSSQDILDLYTQTIPLQNLSIDQVMVAPLLTLYESDCTDLRFILRLLHQTPTNHVPILDVQNHLVGVLNQDTLLHLAAVPISPMADCQNTTDVVPGDLKKRWEDAVECAGDGVWDWNIPANQVFFSQQWKAMLGYADTEISNCVEEWESRIHPDDKAQCFDALNQCLKREQPRYHIEHRLRCKDGSYRWILARGKVIAWTPDSQPIRMIGTHSDIQDRKQAERQFQNLIEGTAATTGQDFFPALVSHMAEVVNVSYALVTELTDEHLHVLAFWANGTFNPSFSYSPSQTPCEQALQHGKFYCESLVQKQFPSDLDLVEMEAESYLGIALQDTHGNAIGNLCILDKKPIQKIHRAEKLLRVFAARAAAELERKRVIQELEQLNQTLETKIKERTAALQQSEERWQLGLKGANDGIWDWDLSNNTIFFSDRWKEIRGFTPKEINNTPDEYLNRIHPQDYAQVIMAVNDHFAKKTEFFEVEYRVRHKGGFYMWVLDRAQAQRDACGQIVRMIGTNSNISTRKQAEAQLQEQKQFLRSINDGVDCPIFVIDVFDSNTFAYSYWNAAAEKASGIPVSEIVGKSPEDIYGISAGTRERQRLQQCINTGVPLSYEEPALFCSQKESWWLTTLNPQKDSGGQTYRIVGTTFDISDRKQAESQLAISRQKYYSLIQSVNGIVWEYDLHQNKFTFVSNKAQELLGYPIENWTTTPDFWEKVVYFEDILDAETRFDEASKSHRKSCEREYRMVAADGHLVWVYDISSFNHDEHGNATTSSGVLIDIGDRKRLEEEQKQLLTTLECTNAELVRATRLKDEFLANMSHELRTPLNVILGMSECLKDEVLGTINERQQNSIVSIERSGTHLLELINDILDVAKIEAGQIELHRTPTSVHVLCQSSVGFIKQQAFQKKIQLNIQLQPELPKLLVDERRVRQVLINLLNNAVKFTPEGGTITLEAVQVPSILSHRAGAYPFLRICVIDTGIGIASENIKKLFQPFIQIDSALNRQYTGTGLGLALVKRIVELHGGTVGLTSEIDVGSCFMIDLPCVES